MRRMKVLTWLMIVALTGGLALVWYANRAEPEPTAYDWGSIRSATDYAENIRSVLSRSYPAWDLPPDQQDNCRVRVVTLPGDPLLAKTRLIIVAQKAPEADPFGRGDYRIYDGPAAPELQLTLPRYLRDYGFGLWAYAYVDEGQRTMSWTTYGIESKIPCDRGAVLNLLAEFDMDGGGGNLRVDPMP